MYLPFLLPRVANKCMSLLTRLEYVHRLIIYYTDEAEMEVVPSNQDLNKELQDLKKKNPNAALNCTSKFIDLRECPQKFQDLFMSAWKVRFKKRQHYIRCVTAS